MFVRVQYMATTYSNNRQRKNSLNRVMVAHVRLLHLLDEEDMEGTLG